jgi:hypothetical protein
MTVFVSDTFTDTNGTLLEDHTPEVGGAWVKRSSGSVKVNNNQIEGVFGLGYYTNAAVPGGAGYDITYNWESFSSQIGVVARFLDMSNFYRARYYSGEYDLKKVVSGSWSLLDLTAEAAPGFPAACKFEILDATKKFYVGGAEKITTADNTLTAAGVVGVYIRWDDDELDDFAADDTGAAASENASMQPIHHWWPR